MIQFSSFVQVGMNRDYISKAQTPNLTKNIKNLQTGIQIFMSILDNLKL